MSDRRGYPTAYRRSALPQHVRQRGFQPLPMLPVAPRTPLRVVTYARWAGRLARLHPAVRALSTALDIISLLPKTEAAPQTVEIPGYEKINECPGAGNLYNYTGGGPCSYGARLRRCGGASGTYLRFAYSTATLDQPCRAQYFWSEGGFEFRRISGAPQYGPITIKPGRPGTFVPGRISLPGGQDMRPPQWQPEAWPIGVPAPTPAPVPFPAIPGRVPNPNRSPTEQTEFGNEPPNPQPAPEVPTPGVIVLPTPGNPTPEPSPSPQPNTPFPGPPATSRTRERKVILALAGVPARIVSAATETKDVIDAFWSAMPEQFQRAHKFRYGRLTRPHEKALLIWENLDQLDIGAAITNLAWEQLEDMAYGRLGKLQARAARKRRAMHGFTLGPAL